MSPFDVFISEVPEAQLGELLARLHADGFAPQIAPTGTQPAGSATFQLRGPAPAGELPAEWHVVRELDGQSYAWPELRDHFGRYRVFAARTAREGAVHIGLGETMRENAWGRDRKYVVAFLSSAAPQVPLVEFLEVDDYAATRELLAIIRGSDGGKKMYGPGDTLPDVYQQNFRTELYADRVVYPRSWNKLAVIAHEDDSASILNHALLQARRRGNV